MGGGSSAPATPTPEDAAKAQAMSELAGAEFNLGTAPMQAYAEALDKLQFDPIFQKIQNANQANAALATARAQHGVNQEVNPWGESANTALTAGTSARLQSVFGRTPMPGLSPSNTSGYLNYPSSNQLPDLGQAAAESKAIASTMPNINFGRNTVSLSYPSSTPSFDISQLGFRQPAMPGQV